MLKKYEDGKRYVFSKNKYIESVTKSGFTKAMIEHFVDDWAGDIDGEEVSVISSTFGTVNTCLIVPWWCEEVAILKLL